MVYKKRSFGERLFTAVCYIIILFMVVVTLYPFIYLISCSISSASSVMKNEVIFLPKEITFKAYTVVVKYKGIWLAYFNTIFYTVAGTLLSLILTTLAAYPLSKARWGSRKVMGIFVVFTMWFSGGIIPFYLNLRNLNLIDNRLGIILYPAVGAFLIIMLRTFFSGIPDALEESAMIEGANDWQILLRIMIPLSKPILATIALYYAIPRWNSYFWEMMLLSSDSKIPVQVLLQRMIIQSQVAQDVARALAPGEQTIPNTIKFATIIVTTLPIVIVYPFLQKYFVSGSLQGGIKE